MDTNELTNIFGDVIYSYTREDAINDGVLVDLTRLYPSDTRLFKHPVACTPAVWERINLACIETGEDVGVYIWDMCFMAVKFPVRLIDDSTILFRLGIPIGSREIELKIVCHPGDDGEPVLTIMFPHED